MNLYFIGRSIVLKGIVKYYGRGKNIPHTFGYTVCNVIPTTLVISRLSKKCADSALYNINY